MNLLGLFPGQGSQKVGMGKQLCDESELAKEFYNRADQALGFAISEICFNGPVETLNQTQYAQPAILLVSVICYEFFKYSKKAELKVAAGHSLGEFSALVAAGALDFEDAIKLVHRRGQYMQQAVPLGAGKMIAVLGKERSELEAICKSVSSGVVEVANINAPGQIVIAGEKAGVDAAVLAMPGVRVIELPVTVPSHTSLMKSAADKLAVDLANIEIKKCDFPVIANVNAKALSEPDQIRQALINQLTNPVLWVDSMQVAAANFGISKTLEFGHGQVLSGLLKRINPTLQRASIDSLKSIESI